MALWRRKRLIGPYALQRQKSAPTDGRAEEGEGRTAVHLMTPNAWNQ